MLRTRLCRFLGVACVVLHQGFRFQSSVWRCFGSSFAVFRGDDRSTIARHFGSLGFGLIACGLELAASQLERIIFLFRAVLPTEGKKHTHKSNWDTDDQLGGVMGNH